MTFQVFAMMQISVMIDVVVHERCELLSMSFNIVRPTSCDHLNAPPNGRETQGANGSRVQI